MPDSNMSITHIALVGGGNLCKEVLEKTTFDYTKEEVFAPIFAVVDADPKTPGMLLADELGLPLVYADPKGFEKFLQGMEETLIPALKSVGLYKPMK